MTLAGLYLAPLDTISRGAGRPSFRRPRGVSIGPMWSCVCLSDSLVLLGTTVPLSTVPAGVRQLASASSERLTAQNVTRIANALGETLDTTRHRDLPTLLLDLFTIQLAGGKRRELQPATRGRAKQLEVWLGGELCAVKVIPSGGAEEFTDDFNREDENPIAGDWTPIVGDFQISSNKAIATNSAVDDLARYEVDLSDADSYAQAMLTLNESSDHSAGPTIRGTSGDFSCYGGGDTYFSGQYWVISEFNASGAQTELTTAASDTVDGDVLTIVANGSSLELFNNGLSVLETTDPTLTGLRGGLWIWPGSAGNALDDWSAGAGSPFSAFDPANLTVTPVGTTAQLDWDASAGADDYLIFRRSPATGVAFTPGVDVPLVTGRVPTDYDDTGLAPGSYDYQVFGRIPAGGTP